LQVMLIHLFFLPIASERLVFQSSLNGQFLLEGSGQLITVANISQIIGSGNFFNNSGTLYLDSSLSASGLDSFYYTIRDAQSPLSFESSVQSTMIAGFNTAMGASGSEYDFYLNGVKLYSGISYNLSANQIVWIDSDTTTTGRLHGMVKKRSSSYSSGDEHDFYGTYFKKGQSNLTVNGKNIDNSNYIEFYTGYSVNLNTGVQFYISGSTTGSYNFTSS
jgi:hypothetical protein